MSEHAFALGWASTSITPDAPVQLAGQMHERVSEHVHDPCTATALAIEGRTAGGETEQAIMVCCDLVHVTRDVVERLRERVGAQLPDFDPRKLLVNVTHTHTGPTISEGVYREPEPGVMRPSDYADLLIERTAAIAAEAWQQRAPAGLSTALGHAALGYNRRVVYRDGSAKMYGKSDDPNFVGIEGGMDPGLELAFTWSPEGKLTGVIVNVACPSQVVEGQHFVSADFWKPARDELRRRLGEDLHVYPMCSAAGDQSPRDLVRRNRGEPSMRQIEGMNELGRRLALAVEDALHTAQGPVMAEAVFEHRPASVSLPRRRVTPAEVELARQTAAEMSKDGGPDPASRDARLLRRHERVIERFETQDDDPQYTTEVHVLRLGELAIATNPFELFLDFGQQIKARSRAEQTMLVQLANDRGAYLPTAKAVAGGSYSAMIHDNIVGPEGGDVLVERTLELIESLWPSEVEQAV